MTQATLGKISGVLLALVMVAALMASAGMAFAQTDTTNGNGTMQTTGATGTGTGGTGDATTPGVPATGAGGVDPMTVVLVVLAAVVVAGGLGYLLTTPRTTSQ